MIIDVSTCFQPCTEVFRKTMGLPCKDEIQHLLFRDKPIGPKHIDCQWYVDGADQEFNELIPRQPVQEPVKV